MKKLQLSSCLSIVIFAAACSHGYAVWVELDGRPQATSAAEADQIAIEIAAEVARRTGLHESSAYDPEDGVSPYEGYLARYFGIYADEAPAARVTFHALRDPKTGRLAFSIVDLRNGEEHRVVKRIREELEREIEARLPGVRAEVRGFQTEGRGLAP